MSGTVKTTTEELDFADEFGSVFFEDLLRRHYAIRN
jgi:hypothetical protein